MHDVRPDLASLGALLADPSRAAMLWSLMDGQRRPAGELAQIAGLTPQAASAHFTKLSDGGLIVQEVRGRWRYYSLAGPAVADLIERVASFSSREGAIARRTVTTLVPVELRFARSCYDHLAGRLALTLLDGLRRRGWLSDYGTSFVVTPSGRSAFGQLGIDVDALASAKRPIAKSCIDWTERLPHLSGGLGASLLTAFQTHGWLVRIDGGRALELTPRGRTEMAAWIADVEIDQGGLRGALRG